MTSDKIKTARKNAGISQLELAQRLHVAQGTVANWETNKRKPDISTLCQIADALGCPTNVLIDDTIEFDFVPHENESAVITCPICGYDYSSFVRTVNVKFNNEKSSGIALEFSGECEHTFYLLLETYKGNSYLIKTDENCTVTEVPEIEEETAPVPLTELLNSPDEKLIRKFNKLDRHGREIVKTILNIEYDRCNYNDENK